MINIEREYRKLMYDILATGKDKSDRTGTGTKSVFGRTIQHDMSEGFPMLTSKKVSFNAARTELLWILNGRTDLKYLEDNGGLITNAQVEQMKRWAQYTASNGAILMA